MKKNENRFRKLLVDNTKLHPVSTQERY